MIEVIRYQPEHRDAWDATVLRARAGHFMFRRDYMEYHQDRFLDASLILRGGTTGDEAVLPANIDGDALWSHQGLSFGGLVVGPDCRAATIMAMMEAVLVYARGHGLKKIVYKPVPHIYHRQPAEDDVYGLFRLGARLSQVLLSTTIDPVNSGAVAESRVAGAKRATKSGIDVRESRDIGMFFSILERDLADHHGSRPVHSAVEMVRLCDRFPTEIKLHAAYNASRMVAGTITYETETVCHTQYIASTPEGRETRAIDAVLIALIARAALAQKVFDFGHSTEQAGKVLNAPLCRFKERFGGSGTTQSIYVIDI